MVDRCWVLTERERETGNCNMTLKKEFHRFFISSFYWGSNFGCFNECVMYFKV
jgi:hypothetical protein